MLSPEQKENWKKKKAEKKAAAKDAKKAWKNHGFMYNASGDAYIGGVTTFPGGSFDDLKIDGVATVDGNLDTKKLDIDGVFVCKGSIVCTDIDCDGTATISGTLRANTIDVDGIVTILGDKVEADRIRCDGVVTAKGQVSADVVEAEGFINASEIVGDSITIHSFRISPFFKLWLKLKEAVRGHDSSKVDLIEATTIDLRGVYAKLVSGENVTIGAHCIIERVDCTGKLVISPDAQVGEIVGETAK